MRAESTSFLLQSLIYDSPKFQRHSEICTFFVFCCIVNYLSYHEKAINALCELA